AILVYDWFLCLDQEVRFIWNWRSKVTGSTLVYALSRYALLIYILLAVATNYPMSDLVTDGCRLSGYPSILTPAPCNSCRANIWAQTATLILGTIAFSAFSALRAYALSNRNIWLTTIIVLLALPPTATNILTAFYDAFTNQPSPFNCSQSTSLSPTLSIRFNVVWGGSLLAAELLVVSITWWYSYQSYRIRKGINLGKTISSLLIYNGSLYFLYFLRPCTSFRSSPARYRYVLPLQITHITMNHHTLLQVADTASNAVVFLKIFYNPITSILICRFMLSLRQFDSSPASVTYHDSEMGSRVREHTASRDILHFAAQPSDSLPAFIASFAGPVHVGSAMSETDPDAIDDDGAEWQEMDVMAPTRTTPSSQPESPAPEQPQASDLAHSVQLAGRHPNGRAARSY
ncbi:hypothetical protein LXA43DRAFT_1123642, partial [Ganoderma leucocontextum]